MKKNSQILLIIVVIGIIQLGFWGFIYLSQKYTKNKLVNQVISDNQAIGEQILTLLKKAGLTTENPETNNVLQSICDKNKLPNGGFICFTNSLGKLIAAPGLKPGKNMQFSPEFQNLNFEKKDVFSKSSGSDSIFKGYAYFSDKKRSDVVISLLISNDCRIFVHQNGELIKQQAWDTIKPLILFGFIITFFAATLTYHFSNNINLEFKTIIDRQTETLKKALNKIKDDENELDLKHNEISQQNSELNKTKLTLSEKNKEITENIKHSEKIMNAMFPKSKIENNIISSHFILFMPKNLISGDFYWYHNVDDLFFIAVADCTGHGVHGAFMSAFGISLLNKIVVEKRIKDPGIILEYMRKNVVGAFGKEYVQNAILDGMDIALCVINTSNYMMHFSGANNPAICLRENEVFELKADKMPVGLHPRMEDEFITQSFQLQANDKLYLFSDGFYDQFGGKQGQKILLKNFKKLLSEIKDLQMEDQKNILEDTIVDWKGNYEQVDDITVVGLKIS